VDDNERIRARARRAALAVTLALGMGGCYAEHRATPRADAGELRPDAGELERDAGDRRADAGYDAGVPGECTPDPDCNGPFDHPRIDGDCDWAQYNACCDAHAWDIQPCWLPGGPLSPPEMPA